MLKWAALAFVVVAGCTTVPGTPNPGNPTGPAGGVAANVTQTPTSAASSTTDAPPPVNASSHANATHWPPMGSAAIRPGVQTVTAGGQCTSNFVFVAPDNSTLYVGQAAHCASKGGSTSTNGCQTDSQPLGTRVEVDGTDGHAYGGTLAYSSWLAMHVDREGDADTCAYNDFALVRLDPAAANATHPAVLYYGGPTRVADASKMAIGDKVLTYGNSGLRQGVAATSPKEGLISAPPGTGWTMDVYTASPGIPGDSGSGVMTTDGQALGVLVTLSATGSNGVSVLSHLVAFEALHGPAVRLATWTQIQGGPVP
ncbi:MAG: serine protease family protein [Thermoplasmatota archaeon]